MPSSGWLWRRCRAARAPSSVRSGGIRMSMMARSGRAVSTAAMSGVAGRECRPGPNRHVHARSDCFHSAVEHCELTTTRDADDRSAIARLTAEIDHLDETELPSPVMVWTAERTGHFLDFTGDDRLYPLYHLIAYRGLRRGEACGVRWADLDATAGALAIVDQLVQLGTGGASAICGGPTPAYPRARLCRRWRGSRWGARRRVVLR